MDGIIALWKERGMTSHDCVFKLRKILKQKKIGHGGTLDPEVDGVLPICVGKATRVIEFMQDEDKIYEGQITLGFSTTTEDAYGETVETSPVLINISTDTIDSVMSTFLGEITQIPPMYSAVKHNGRRLYEYAREGKVVEREGKNVMIHSFERTSSLIWDQEKHTMKWDFKVVCSKGTYVRTLAVDLGNKLGYAAHMSDLTRTSSCGLNKKDTYTIDEIRKCCESNNQSFLFPIEYGVSSLQQIECSHEILKKAQYGQLIAKKELGSDYTDKTTALFYNNSLCAIVEPHELEKEFVRPRKVFLAN